MISLGRVAVTSLSRSLQRTCSSKPKSHEHEVLYDGHIQTDLVQRMVLALGSGAMALGDPWRADMVATNGEVTGTWALQRMLDRMKNDEEGQMVLRVRPRINTELVDFNYLRQLPEETLGSTYARYSDYHGISPDTRDPVHFVDDPDLAYVMQRYREVHDIVHAVLDMPTNMVGEVAVKWVEGLQNGLPMCIAGAIFGPLRFTPKQVEQFRAIRSWAAQVGVEARPFINVYYEKRWEQDLADFKREMKIPEGPNLKKMKK